MRIDWQRLIKRVHGSGVQFVLSITGGGSGAIGRLLAVPGGSRSLLEAVVPYDVGALIEFLGAVPDQACSAATAGAMALRARERAVRLAGAGNRVLGVGVTASLVSDRPKKGAHRCHIATASDREQCIWSVVLDKGRRSRRQEEDLVARATLLAVAAAAGVAAPRIAELVGKTDRVREQRVCDDDLLSRLVAGSVSRVTALPDGQLVGDAAVPTALLPGSFHPPHAGHLELARVAGQMLGCPVSYELSIVNVDKPALTAATVRQRLALLRWSAPVELTRAATFAEKARLFPGAAFVVGVDTARRIVDPAYYAGDAEQMARAVAEIAAAGSRFLVAGRQDSTGRFVALRDLVIPDALAPAFAAIPEAQFRMDISSTQLRSRELPPQTL